MASKVKASNHNPATPPTDTSDWFSLVNRGGLFNVTDSVLDLFIAIEMKTVEELSSIFQHHGRGISKVNNENIQWLMGDEEVQSVWHSIIDEDDVSKPEELLNEICFLWVTTRSHSKAHRMKNELNTIKAQGMKGRSL